MMKKNIYSIIFGLTACGIAHSQVGINNNSPQQTLHVSGTSSGVSQNIMRVDGLNSTQNTAHENANSQKRVFANANGDLVILNNAQQNTLLNIQLPATAITGGNEGIVTSLTFTLAYRSLVHFESREGFTINTNINNGVLDNGQARSFGGYYKFTSAPAGVATNTRFGDKIISVSTTSGSNQLDGIFYLEPRKDLVLPAGSYTVSLYGFSGSAALPISVNNINQTNQQMRVSITPISYN
ncbi:hypothetical protein [Chryseobacterium sp. Leaf180]|jgi:hypothetical protein|uniref:hypothetical protein n=1 Tax=Chryseobacterium sp. Leaf180 TaxID=1736289 RepID=UPI000AAD22BB|nr:hypothetical protein [Chryseobacterium sp. Leaf180]